MSPVLKPASEQQPQLYKQKEFHPSNKDTSLKEDFKLQKGTQAGQCLHLTLLK